MKKSIVFLCAMMLALSALVCPQLKQASTSIQSLEKEYFDLSWEGDDEDLWLAITSSELQFDDGYKTYANQNSLGCEITCRPLDGQPVFSAEGHELQEVTINVQVKNTSNSNEVVYTQIFKWSFRSVSEEGIVKKVTDTFKREGTIATGWIDLNQRPRFVDTEDEGRHVIVFRNLVH